MSLAVRYVAILVVFTTVGVVTARYAETLARIGEMLDALGSRRRGPVEPTQWRVDMTRYGGIAMAAVGGILLALLAWGVLTS